MKFPALLSSLVVVAFTQEALAGWITFQNENKIQEGLPCIGSLYGNDNYLISRFDCGATDWNASMCGIHCFPFSATTCVGRVPIEQGGEGNGLWYQPHGVPTACSFLGAIKVEGKFDKAGPNVTSCGYVDWPQERGWGTVFDRPPFDVKTDGCWDVPKQPDAKYPKHYGHFYDGARPLNKTWCDLGVSMSCGKNEDPKCEYSFDNDIRINCTKTDMPSTSKNGTA